MPTRISRQRFVLRAIRCFLAQTHEQKELLVLDDGPPGLAPSIPHHPSIQYIRVDRPMPSLGEKRNLACQLARGDYIAHWDDDDWSHPERLARQLSHGEIRVTGFNRIYFFDDRNGQAHIYTGAHRYVLGTSLLYSRAWWQKSRFPGVNVGEDNTFIRAAKQVLTMDDGLGMMVATSHNNCTSPRKIGSCWKPVDKGEIPLDYWNLGEGEIL